MADDHTFRLPRTSDPYRRAVEPSRPEPPLPASERAGASDPLAELARLIGKNDPYAEFGVSDDRELQHQAGDAAEYEEQPENPRGKWQNVRHPLEPPRQRSYADAQDAIRPQAQPRVSVPRPAPEMRASPSDRAYESAAAGEAEEYFDDEGSLEGHDEQIYDDPPRAYRRSGLATALALVGCAMLGTAAAYGYRSFYSHAASAGPPPVIAAESAPSKIVPTTAADPQSGKVVQERIANAGKEQLVTSQEEPVAMKELGTQASPRVILPAPVPPAQPGTTSSSPGSSDAKKVRTLTIHPDSSDPSGRPISAPRSITPGAPNSAAKPTAAPRASGGPLSLDPQEPAPSSSQRTRTATLPASAATGSTGGTYVQLSSHKSEADAQASFRSLQAKFPNELSGRQVVIRRADLGTKGVFYRTMVGPFGSASDASQFCANYKAAGGHCVVPNG